jgi:hypothetical protein
LPSTVTEPTNPGSLDILIGKDHLLVALRR